MDSNDRTPDDANLDEEMERESDIRRDTQIRGSLGVPPSGDERERRPADESIPELGRLDDEDRMSER